MKLFVLAGGFGSRLKPAVADVPKALAPIGNLPFLHLQVEHWIEQGVRNFTFLLHHQSNEIIDFLQAQQSGLFKYCQINWLVEPEPMDTGGAIAYALSRLNLEGGFLLVNADTWLGSGINDMMKSVAPSMAIINLPDVSRYGQVHFNQNQCITAFEEKNGQSASGWINAGLYHLSSKLFKNWDGQPFSLERDLLPSLVINRQLKAVPLQTDFIDIGVPADYYRFCNWVDKRFQTFL
jgi:D-glycero-alpha-D-manno-heptose 1-phosphate guanylyltransferase